MATADCLLCIRKILLVYCDIHWIDPIDIDVGKNYLVSAVQFVHNLSIVDSARLDAVDDVDDGEGRLDGRLVLEVLDRVGIATLYHLVKRNVE